jgi:VWFA-related protein
MPTRYPLAGLSFAAGRALLLWTALAVVGISQTAPPASNDPSKGQAAALEQSSAPGQGSAPPSTAFKIRVQENLVLVRVTVRDSKGNYVRGLRQENFRLSDDKRAQTIDYFDEEDQTAPAAASAIESGAAAPAASEPAPGAPVFPDRYVAFFFDDIHGGTSDLKDTGRAVSQYLARGIRPADRVGVFTSSGKVRLDFTADRDALAKALAALKPSPVLNSPMTQCPDIPDAMAYRIVQLDDPDALQLARNEVVQCARDSAGSSPSNPLAIQNQARMAAQTAFDRAKRESLDTLDALDHVIAHSGVMPGQRSVVIVSPGFFTMATLERVDRLADEALRLNVVLDALEAKGLANDLVAGDASTSSALMMTSIANVGDQYQQQVSETRFEHENVMAAAAASTGGRFFHNSNDFNRGVREVTAPADVVYTLAFSPHGINYDGSFHKLKVEVTGQPHLTVEARRGYFAPAAAPDSTRQEQEAIEQALTSNQEVNDIPSRMAMQVFKLNAQQGRLRVVTHLDLKFLEMHKENGINVDHLKLAAVLLDKDGFRQESQEKNLDLRLPDDKLQELRASGLTVEISFDVKPGLYTVREVFRDANGALSAMSRHINVAL